MGDRGGEEASERKRVGCAGGEAFATRHHQKRQKPSDTDLPKEDLTPTSLPLADFTSLSLASAEDPAGAEVRKHQGPMAGKGHGSRPPSDDDRVGSQNQIRKVEYVRLIQQALYALGYPQAAGQLEIESQVKLERGEVASLRAAVMEGRWDDCSRILRGLADVTPEALHQAEFLLQQQKFLEFLEASNTPSALSQLRLHLAPLCTDRKRLHQLASWLMCTSREDLIQRSGWQGKGSASRMQLMGEIQDLLPPSLMIPDRRLEKIVEQCLTRQEAECTYHNYPCDTLTLFSDHDCGRDQIPTVTTQILDQHTDEVWHVQFSHDGRRLASASKDCQAIIWEVVDDHTSRVLHVLTGHTQAVAFVAWSPDDSMIFTCSSDRLVKLWDTATGKCLHTFAKHFDCVTAGAWFPCGRKFVTVAPIKAKGATDRALFVWDVDGNELPDFFGDEGTWPDHLSGPRINDITISHDGRYMVLIFAEMFFVVHCMETGRVFKIQEPRSITSLSTSLDSAFALANISNGTIHLWDLEALTAPTDPLQQASFQYKGQVQGRFVIRSCFGGSHQSFIASGSEDSQVYMWHRPTGELLHVLPGHAGTVNAVSWPVTRPLMFASASDDSTIRIWGPACSHEASSQRNGQLSGLCQANGVH